MALDKAQRRFTLIVTEIDVNLLPAERRKGTDGDLVQIEFAGKLLPSTRKRIVSALMDADFELRERRLA